MSLLVAGYIGSLARRTLALAIIAGAVQASTAAAQAPDARATDRAANGPTPSWTCRTTGAPRFLPPAARESSGLARSLGRSGVLWTHNDRGNDPDLFAVDENGRLLQSVRAPVPAIDWEDLEVGSCEAGSCLYVGDIGDNDADRELITIYRIPEPAADDRTADAATALPARFPDGPRDAEALFALPTGDLYVVTKGRRQQIALYRYPAPQRPDEIVRLERVRELFPEPANDDDRVTAATSTPDGRWVGIRTYRALHIYEARRLVGGGRVDPTTIDLAPLFESQGEGLAMTDGGTVWLSSEAANRRSAAVLSRLECSLPR